MAFGSSSVLDNFNRTNEGPPPSSNWTLNEGDSHLVVVSNVMEINVSTWGSIYWNVATYGADCEVFITQVLCSDQDYPIIIARLVNPGSTWDGYSVGWAGNGDLYINRYDDGSDTTLEITNSVTKSNGNKWGLECIGSTIKSYNNTGGGWTEIDSTTDGTYSSAGYIGFGVWDNYQGNSGWDDFSGGTVAGAATLTISVSDALTVADSPTITPLVLGNVSQSESVTLGDTPTISRQEATTLTISASDGLTVGDSPILQLDRLITSSDGLTVGDSATITPLVLGDISQSDGLTVGDTPTVSRQEATTLTISSSDGLTVGDSASVHRRAAWYNPESITVNTGSVKNGTIESTWADDGTKLQLGEVTGTPGFDYDFYFYDVPALAFSIGINGYYEGNVGHQIKIQQYNFNTTNWTDLTAELDDFPTAASDQDYDFAIFNDADYNSSGEMRFKIVHNSGGSNTHNFYIDHMLLEAHLAVHTNEDITLTDTPALDALLIDLTASDDLTVGEDATVAVESLIAALEIRITPGVVVS